MRSRSKSPLTAVRAGLLLLTLGVVIMVCVPLQWVAVRQNWRLRTMLPRLFCRIVCRLLGIRTRFRGRLTGRSPRIVVPNHVSWTDVLVLGCRQAPLRFVAKSEVAGWPLLGTIARLTESLDRLRQAAPARQHRAP